MALETSCVVPFWNTWYLLIIPAVREHGRLTTVNVAYKEYNRYNDKNLDIAMRILCLGPKDTMFDAR